MYICYSDHDLSIPKVINFGNKFAFLVPPRKLKSLHIRTLSMRCNLTTFLWRYHSLSLSLSLSLFLSLTPPLSKALRIIRSCSLDNVHIPLYCIIIIYNNIVLYFVQGYFKNALTRFYNGSCIMMCNIDF